MKLDMICPSCNKKGFTSKVVNWKEVNTKLKCGTCGDWSIVADWILPNTWFKVEDRLPKPEQMVIAFYKNYYGKNRRIRAFYAPQFTVETSVDNDWYEYNKEGDDDNAYLPEGWYEANEHEDIHWHVTDTVTHWMALPLPPVE